MVTLSAALLCVSVSPTQLRPDSAPPARQQTLNFAPPHAAEPVLSDYLAQYSFLSLDDVRQLPMRLRSLSLDENMFFRGTADEFYRWCATHCSDWTESRDNWVLLHGDVHLGNVGAFSTPGSQSGLRFGVVDLDEVIEGPFEADLLRALVSIRFAARAEGTDVDHERTLSAAAALVQSYASALEGTTSQAEMAREPAVAAVLERSTANNRAAYHRKYIHGDPMPRFRRVRMKGGEVSDLLEPVEPERRAAVIEAIASYIGEGSAPEVRREFRIHNHQDVSDAVVDMARWTRVRSSGSQGLEKYFVLLRQPLTGRSDDVILELKEQPTPAAIRAGFLPAESGTPRAAAVARGYQRYYGYWPQLVGYTELGGRSFLVSMRDPFAEELKVGDLEAGLGPQGTIEVGRILGMVVGDAHRADLLSKARNEQINRMAVRASALHGVLAQRAALVDRHLQVKFSQLRHDPLVRQQVLRANAHIQREAEAER